MELITAIEIKTLRDTITIMEAVRNATVSPDARARLQKQIDHLFRLKHKASLLRYHVMQRQLPGLH